MRCRGTSEYRRTSSLLERPSIIISEAGAGISGRRACPAVFLQVTPNILRSSNGRLSKFRQPHALASALSLCCPARDADERHLGYRGIHHCAWLEFRLVGRCFPRARPDGGISSNLFT